MSPDQGLNNLKKQLDIDLPGRYALLKKREETASKATKAVTNLEKKLYLLNEELKSKILNEKHLEQRLYAAREAYKTARANRDTNNAADIAIACIPVVGLIALLSDDTTDRSIQRLEAQKRRMMEVKNQVRSIGSKIDALEELIAEASTDLATALYGEELAKQEVAVSQKLNKALAEIVSKVAVSSAQASTLSALGESLVNETQFQLKMGHFAQFGNIVENIQDTLPILKDIAKDDATGVLTRTALNLENIGTETLHKIRANAKRNNIQMNQPQLLKHVGSMQGELKDNPIEKEEDDCSDDNESISDDDDDDYFFYDLM